MDNSNNLFCPPLLNTYQPTSLSHARSLEYRHLLLLVITHVTNLSFSFYGKYSLYEANSDIWSPPLPSSPFLHASAVAAASSNSLSIYDFYFSYLLHFVFLPGSCLIQFPIPQANKFDDKLGFDATSDHLTCTLIEDQLNSFDFCRQVIFKCDLPFDGTEGGFSVCVRHSKSLTHNFLLRKHFWLFRLHHHAQEVSKGNNLSWRVLIIPKKVSPLLEWQRELVKSLFEYISQKRSTTLMPFEIFKELPLLHDWSISEARQLIICYDTLPLLNNYWHLVLVQMQNLEKEENEMKERTPFKVDKDALGKLVYGLFCWARQELLPSMQKPSEVYNLLQPLLKILFPLVNDSQPLLYLAIENLTKDQYRPFSFQASTNQVYTVLLMHHQEESLSLYLHFDPSLADLNSSITYAEYLFLCRFIFPNTISTVNIASIEENYHKALEWTFRYYNRPMLNIMFQEEDYLETIQSLVFLPRLCPRLISKPVLSAFIPVISMKTLIFETGHLLALSSDGHQVIVNERPLLLFECSVSSAKSEHRILLTKIKYFDFDSDVDNVFNISIGSIRIIELF